MWGLAEAAAALALMAAVSAPTPPPAPVSARRALVAWVLVLAIYLFLPSCR